VVKKSLEITAVKGAILCVLRAIDFFQRIKQDKLSSQKEKFRVCCAELFLVCEIFIFFVLSLSFQSFSIVDFFHFAA